MERKQKNAKWIIWIAAGLALLLVVIAYQRFVLGWNWAAWSGFGAYTTAKIDPVSGEVKEITLQTRTLWDWLELLIIPAVLAGAALFFNRAERKNEQKIAEERTRSDRAIAADYMQEDLLQNYIDHMTELLLDKGLRTSAPGDEIRDIVRTRSLTALRILDPVRKGLLVRFLSEASLIDRKDFIVDLSQADLRWANLSEASLPRVCLGSVNFSESNLSGADLNGTDLRKSDLIRANLNGIDLTRADLRAADLSEADLSGANLTKANLNGVNLRETSLSGADLSSADLTGANLRDADLSGANLLGARVSPDQLAQAKSLQGATLPDGSLHD
jgi:uncharacterized protein YjbI with pentapeptide repeats